MPIAIAAAVAGFLLVTESKAARRHQVRHPRRGAGHRRSGQPGLRLHRGGQDRRRAGIDVEPIGYLVLAVVLLAAFVVVELRSSNPLLPLRVVLDRNRGGTFLASLLVGAGLFAMFLFLTYYFQLNLGYSPLKSGFAFLPFSAGIIVTAGVVSSLLPKVGPEAADGARR